MLRFRLLLCSLCLGLILVGGCTLLHSNSSPTAVVGATIVRGYAPLEVVLDGRLSADPDGDPLTYAWTFGDGAEAAGSTTAHTYAMPGTYEVTLRVIDGDGAQDTAALTIEVLEIPEGFVALRFEWIWEGETQRFDALVSWNLYQTYRGRLRIPFVDNYDYGVYVEDPLDDPTLGDLADALWEQAGGTTTDYVRYVLRFVQYAIAYRADPPSAEWPLYPIETLVDRAGDCEDASILYVSLLRERNVPCKLAFVDTDDNGLPDHVLAFVPSASAIPSGCAYSLTVFEIDGKLYAVAETTGSLGDLGVGCDPWGLSTDDLAEVWSF